jgi:hypothetical protein
MMTPQLPCSAPIVQYTVTQADVQFHTNLARGNASAARFRAFGVMMPLNLGR